MNESDRKRQHNPNLRKDDSCVMMIYNNISGAGGGGKEAKRPLPQIRVSSWALGMSNKEYTAPACSRDIRTTFLQTIFCWYPPTFPLLLSAVDPDALSSLPSVAGIFCSPCTTPLTPGLDMAEEKPPCSIQGEPVQAAGKRGILPLITVMNVYCCCFRFAF